MLFKFLLPILSITLFSQAYADKGNICSDMVVHHTDTVENTELEKNALKVCKKINDTGKLDGSEAVMIMEKADLDTMIDYHLERTTKGLVFIMTGNHYNLAKSFEFNRTIAFVGANLTPSMIAYHSPAKGFITFDDDKGTLLLNNVIIDDTYYGEKQDGSDFIPSPRKEDTPSKTRMIEVVSAKNVMIVNNTTIKGHDHRDLLHLGCNKGLPTTNLTIKDSIFHMAAKYANGVYFNCTEPEHTFKGQIAFNNFIIDLPDNRDTHQHTTPTNITMNLNSTSDSMAYYHPSDTAIILDNKGDISLSDSACNRVTYEGNICSADHSYFLGIMNGSKLFKGILATNIENTKEGSFFTQLEDSSLEPDTFTLKEVCPYSSKYVKVYDKYLPDEDWINHRIYGTPVSDKSSGSDCKTDYEKLKDDYVSMKYARNILIGITTVLGAGYIMWIVYKLQNNIRNKGKESVISLGKAKQDIESAVKFRTPQDDQENLIPLEDNNSEEKITTE